MDEMIKDVLTIRLDLRTILSDDVSLDVQMSDAMLTQKENSRLSELLEQVSVLLLTGIKRRLYSINEEVDANG